MQRILLVDDDEKVRSSLRRLLEHHEYTVFEAQNGCEALQLLHNEHIELVITDLIMPEMEGIELIIALKREAPGAKIIALSGGGRGDPKHYLEMAHQLGADSVFCKPANSEALLSAIRELLS